MRKKLKIKDTCEINCLYTYLKYALTDSTVVHNYKHTINIYCNLFSIELSGIYDAPTMLSVSAMYLKAGPKISF